MSTLVEIQDAVARLPGSERKALQLWLNSQSEPELTALEEQRLLRSLDDAVRDIDAGKGVPMDEVRKRVAHGLQNNLLAAGHRGFGGGCPPHCQEKPNAAMCIGNALIDRVAMLENFPLLGAPCSKQPGVPKLASRPDLISHRFRKQDNSVDILRYWHGAQREPDLRSLD